jgi:Zn-dependent protease
MFHRGYYTIARFRGAPIRLHWSIPLGALVFGRFQLVPGFWLGFFLLVLIHEIGHAIVVRACGMRVNGIDIHGLGGQCRYDGYASSLKISLIAWGGVWAQLALFALVRIALIFVQPEGRFAWEMIYAFTETNLWMAGLNLLPLRPLDGADAWPLFRILWERWRLVRKIRSSATPSVKPAAKPAAQKVEPKYSERVRDPNKSEELFNRLMQNNPVEEEEEER